MRSSNGPSRHQYWPGNAQHNWMPGGWHGGSNGTPNFSRPSRSLPHAQPPRFPYDAPPFGQPRYSMPVMFPAPGMNNYGPPRRIYDRARPRNPLSGGPPPSRSSTEKPREPPSPEEIHEEKPIQQFTILKKEKPEEEEQPPPSEPAPVAAQSSQNGTDGSLEKTKDAVFVEKGKTPMCIINELARHHKILHQYQLTDESGPAHAKTFTVTLRLGMRPNGPEDAVEEYVAKGASIKKAQQTAARMALDTTKFSRPAPKSDKAPGRLMPSVELNALAMKLGMKIYFNVEALPVQLMNGYRRTSCRVLLRVGNKEYVGTGATIQGAKHNAAAKALEEFRELRAARENNTVASTLPFAQDASMENPLTLAPKLSPEELEDQQKIEKLLDSKSPISFLYELGIRHDFIADFTVIKETGPPHLRVFYTRCIVKPTETSDPDAAALKPVKPKASLLTSPIVVEAEGAGKKLSKKNAAEKALQELLKISPELVQPSQQNELPMNARKYVKAVKPQAKKKKLKISKEKAGSVEYGDGINPISRLIQIQQAKKEKEPVYTLLQEKGVQRKREFTVQATCGEFVCEGVGNNKKMAKRAAAEVLLVAMGFNKPMPVPDKPAIKQKPDVDVDEPEPEETEEKKTKGRKVTFDANAKESNDNAPRGAAALAAARGRQQLAAASLTFMNTPSMTSIVGDEPISPPKSQNRRSKLELEYLAQVEGFPVDFASFPRTQEAKEEFLCLVKFPSWKVPGDGTTMPNGVFHGIAKTVEEAQEIASRHALDALADVGLSTVLAKSDVCR